MTWGALLARLWRLVCPLPDICEACVVLLEVESEYHAHGCIIGVHVCPECGLRSRFAL